MDWLKALFAPGASKDVWLGEGQRTTQELGPEAKWLFQYLQSQLGGKTPSYLTRPIAQRWGARRAGIRERVGEGLGPGSGLETAHLLRATTAEGREMGEATERHKAQLLRVLAGLAGRGGTQKTPATWPGLLDLLGGGEGGAGEDIGWLLASL